MIGKIQKWGNSLAVRIPKAIAEEVAAYEGGSVEITVEDGQLVMTPVKQKMYRLEDMVSAITEENRHKEFDAGPPEGNEIW